jgi:hypothetical protein
MSTRLLLPSSQSPAISPSRDPGRPAGRWCRTRAIFALLGPEVYVVDHLLGLGDDGPFVRLLPRHDDEGAPYLPVYTSRPELPTAEEAFEADALELGDFLDALPEGVPIVVDPGSRGVKIAADDLAELAHVLASVNR